MSARDIEAIAARWLVRREDPGLTDAQAAELDAWPDASPAHRVAFWRLEHGWDQVDRLAALRAPDGSERPKRAARMRRSAWPLGVAASVAACLVAGALVWMVADPLGHRTYQTDLGVRETVPLADGSRVELNTQTRLRTAVTTRSREVWLDDGEAYFDVAHDARRPFVVHAGAKTVTVLGTKFSVRRLGDQVMVAVVEGRVRVSDTAEPGPASPPVLTRGETAIAAGPSMIIASRSVDQVNSELSWRQGMLSFDQSTLADAAGEFNRYNHTKLVVADSEAAAIRIGGSFEAGNVDAFARLLQQAYGLKVQRDGDRVTISR